MSASVCRAALLLGLTACGFTPESGDYRLVPADLTTDCPQGAELFSEDPTTVAVLVSESEESFTMQDAGVETPYVYTCTLEGVDFSCPVLERTEMGGTTATLEALVEGSWSASNAFSLTMTASASCEGDGCAYLEQQGFVPCRVSLAGSATRP
jgi:hypothetical protein